MVTTLEVAVALVVLAVVVGAYRVVKAVKPFVWNAIAGLVVFVLADVVVGISVTVDPIVLAIVAVGGVPGAVLVLLLASLGAAFVPGATALAAVVV